MPTRKIIEAMKTWNPDTSHVKMPHDSWNVYNRNASSYWYTAGFLMGLDRNALDHLYLTSDGEVPFYQTVAFATVYTPRGGMRQFHMDLLNQFLEAVHVKLVEDA